MYIRGLRPDSSTFGALLHACAQVSSTRYAADYCDSGRSQSSCAFAPRMQCVTGKGVNPVRNGSNAPLQQKECSLKLAWINLARPDKQDIA